MRAWKLLAALFKINVQMALAYRTDTLINILMSLLGLGWELLGLKIIFSNTTRLGGWGLGELVALLGVFHLVNALMQILIWPNTEQFNTAIRDGSLDYTLLMPANSMFLVTFARMTIWRAWDLLLGAGLIVVGTRLSGAEAAGAVSAGHVAGFLLLAGSGSLILYSLWIVLIAATFWFVKFDNNVTILQALLDTGRYPSSIYPTWLRLIVTFVVPIAVATTVPLQALRGDLGGWQVLGFLGVSAAAFAGASWFWREGIRKYSGASS